MTIVQVACHVVHTTYLKLVLKCYYDEFRIFPIEAINKKNAVHSFQISLFVQEIFKCFKIRKLAK